jgi:hypothetical protein
MQLNRSMACAVHGTTLSGLRRSARAPGRRRNCIARDLDGEYVGGDRDNETAGDATPLSAAVPPDGRMEGNGVCRTFVPVTKPGDWACMLESHVPQHNR